MTNGPLRKAGLAIAASIGLWAATAAPAPLDEQDDEELIVERTVTLEAELVAVERPPVLEFRAIGRFRVRDGEYRGCLLSLAYDYSRPVRLRSWHVHDPSGHRRIGGARVREPALGQWDALLLPGSHQPVDAIVLSLIQTDLNEDEEQRRWHFTAIESIAPLHPVERQPFGEAPGDPWPRRP